MRRVRTDVVRLFLPQRHAISIAPVDDCIRPDSGSNLVTASATDDRWLKEWTETGGPPRERPIG